MPMTMSRRAAAPSDIWDAVAAVCHEGMSTREAVSSLLGRSRKPETYGHPTT